MHIPAVSLSSLSFRSHRSILAVIAFLVPPRSVVLCFRGISVVVASSVDFFLKNGGLAEVTRQDKTIDDSRAVVRYAQSRYAMSPSLRCGIFSRLGNTRNITDMEGLKPEKEESTECIMNDVCNSYIMMFR